MRIEDIHEDENFDCPLCHNEWYVLKEIDGVRYACPCECKTERLFIKSLKAGGILVSELKSKTLESFKTETPWQKEMLTVAKNFLGDPKNGVGFFGKSGTGKTHICFAIMAELMKQGRKCVYFPYRNYIKDLVSKMFNDNEGYQEAIKRYATCDVLYIDDLFKMIIDRDGNANKQEAQVMYDIINQRYANHRLTIFSSEYSTREMIKFEEALASRIYSMCSYGYYCTGENQRYERRLY